MVRFRVCFDQTHLYMKEFLCCMGAVEIPKMQPNRSSDIIVNLRRSTTLEFQETYLVAIFGHTDG